MQIDPLRQWTHRYSIWVIFYGLSIVFLSACSTPNMAGVSATQPTPSPIKVVTTSQPTVVPSPTQSKSSKSCTGYKYYDVCIIDPQHLLAGQPVAPDATTPMIKDMAMAVTTGIVTVSREYGTLYLTLTDEGGSGEDRDYCKQLIFVAFSVTEYDYLFPVTSITCHANKITLGATLSEKTTKKIDWSTSLTVAEEAVIAWNQYDNSVRDDIKDVVL